MLQCSNLQDHILNSNGNLFFLDIFDYSGFDILPILLTSKIALLGYSGLGMSNSSIKVILRYNALE